MKTIFITLLLAFCACQVSAQTIHWTLAGSPYIIGGNSELNYSQHLIIDPGVEVIFAGNFQLKSHASIKAIGTPEQPIIFRAADTTGWHNDESTLGGWRGISMPAGNVSDTFIHCVFKDMKHGYFSWIGPGGIHTYRNLFMRDCEVYHCQNTASSSLGTILHLAPEPGKQVLIESCDIHDNFTRVAAVSIGEGNTIVRHSKLHHNTGGDVVRALLSDEALIEGNEIYENNTDLEGGFAAVQIAGKNVTLKGNLIHHNYSKSVGAVKSTMGRVTIESNHILNNTHDGSWVCGFTDGGGGLHLSHNNSGAWENTEYLVRNNVIANNYAPYYGGAIYMFNSKVWLMNNTIVNNKAKYSGSALYAFGANCQVRAKNNIIIGNVNETPSPTIPLESVRLEGGSVFSFDNNYIANPLALEVKLAAGIPYSGDTSHNIVGSTPGLIAPTNGAGDGVFALNADFGITNVSPCVNKGDTAGAFSSLLDINGHPRVVGNIDIGAYETDVPGSGTNIAQIWNIRSSIKAYPNPSNGLLNLELPTAQGQIMLYELSGRLLARQTHSDTQLSLDLSNYPSGTYLLQWTGEDGATSGIKVSLK
jgi:hypothetical protein